MIRLIVLVMVLIFSSLQYKLWFGEETIPAVMRLKTEIMSEEIKLKILEKQNAKLIAEVKDLKNGTEAVEERARRELGMIKEDETFYQYLTRTKDT